MLQGLHPLLPQQALEAMCLGLTIAKLRSLCACGWACALGTCIAHSAASKLFVGPDPCVSDDVYPEWGLLSTSGCFVPMPGL